jgi:dCMP deaminase
MTQRLSRNELFANVAQLYGQRSTCPRANVGVVAVRDGRVVAAGYNGAPKGHDHCLNVGCEMENDHCVRSVHAEANLISWAAREGIRLHGTTIYITHTPCKHCAKLLINAGVSAVYIENEYGHSAGIPLLFKSKVLVHIGDSS